MPRTTPVKHGLSVRLATEPWEFEAIHRLNHDTFAGEIPQHPADPSGRLVDPFHAENTYLIALRGRELAGMLAVRGNRPFSLDHKLPNLDSYLPTGRSCCEVRLLAVARAYRRGRVLLRLLTALWEYATAQGFDAAVVSATTRQLRMYSRLGFVPFGPLVGRPEAQFQPMFVTRERAAAAFARLGSGRR
ncbi:MAG TPA: GNAT family N-acetyltransferase [Vicinamibacterales bacterium]|nr:GNAT family N-acetyltransferase [Vicinamibacterales bacterium]